MSTPWTSTHSFESSRARAFISPPRSRRPCSRCPCRSRRSVPTRTSSAKATTRSCLILEGHAATYKVTPTGNRQIVAFHIAGDIPDLQSAQLEILDISLGTLTPTKVAFVRHEVINEVCERHFRLARALWRQTLIDAAIFREWVVNVGRREALKALAHLMCEFVLRMRVMGLAEGDECELPMTQAE